MKLHSEDGRMNDEDRDLVAWVARRYNKQFAKLVAHLLNQPSSQFTDGVRRSLTRERHRS